ncbi:MAG: hypothetical protein P8X55_09800 [Desulfosarcinaceae bacterium]
MSSKVNVFKVLGFGLLVLCLCTTLALAGDHDRKQDRKQDRLKDGSCDAIQNAIPGFPLQALSSGAYSQVQKGTQNFPALARSQDQDRDRDRDRDKDGDCDSGSSSGGFGKAKGRG